MLLACQNQIKKEWPENGVCGTLDKISNQELGYNNLVR